MSKRGVKKNWRLIVAPADGGKPFTLVKSERPTDREVEPPAPDTLSALALHRPTGVPDAPADHRGAVATFLPSVEAATEHRIALWGPDEEPLGIVAGLTSRLGNTVADELGRRGYRVTGLIAERSAPGAPVYAIEVVRPARSV